MTTDLAWVPFLLQTADALFPTGAYAHSLGFEESVRLGNVRDEAGLVDFLLQQTVPALREQELPYLRFALDAAAAADMAAICAVDREISAWKIAEESRNASVQLGMRRLKALRVIHESPLLRELEELIGAGHARGHHIVVYALQSALENVPLEAALGAYFYQALAAVCAAALKLIRIGQDGCQRALRRATQLAAPTLSRALQVERSEAGWFNPLLEIASLRHARADERLFIS
jgi:urease accessory protein